MAEAGKGALLDLDTLVERPFIKIGGEPVDILNPDELSVIESHRFGVWARKIEDLASQSGKQAEDELDELVKMVARKICVGASDELFAKLSGAQHWDIFELFTGLLLQRKLKVAGAIAAATGVLPEWAQALTSGSIGANSFPGSSGSTADGRRTGWRRFLPGW